MSQPLFQSDSGNYKYRVYQPADGTLKITRAWRRDRWGQAYQLTSAELDSILNVPDDQERHYAAHITYKKACARYELGDKYEERKPI